MTKSAFEKQRDAALEKSAARRKANGLPPEAAVETAPSFLAEIAADAEVVKAERVKDAKAALTQIREMVEVMQERTRAVATIEEDLKAAKASLFRIASVDLPELLHEAGLPEVKLEDGTKVSVADEISCAITEANRAEAHKWLRENGYESVIRNVVSTSFGKGEAKLADKLFLQLLKKFGDDKVEQKENVHPAALKALLKELMELGKDVPKVTFSIVPYSIAKITAPKAPAARKAVKS